MTPTSKDRKSGSFLSGCGGSKEEMEEEEKEKEVEEEEQEEEEV